MTVETSQSPTVVATAVPALSAASAVTLDPGWPIFQTPLIGRQLVADRTMSFSFAKPAGWSFRAGQFVDITLLDPPETDAEGNLRGFSISSAPHEGMITITTRLRDTAFKRVLQAMPLGTRVTIEGPFGDLRLHHAARPAVLLAGGIGITPFRSILVETVRSGGLSYPIVLLHANRHPEDAAFADELQALAANEPRLTFVPTITAVGGSSQAWDGERGRIDAAMVRRHVSGLPDPIYYIAGPPGMVQALRTMLVSSGIDEDDTRIEEFTGY
ncbi:MAG TPA: FAD-dependent oxidoreductase [Candidatus Limnocylindria bacterium]|jgi:ferredoxin-NADP reductase